MHMLIHKYALKQLFKLYYSTIHSLSLQICIFSCLDLDYVYSIVSLSLSVFLSPCPLPSLGFFHHNLQYLPPHRS